MDGLTLSDLLLFHTSAGEGFFFFRHVLGDFSFKSPVDFEAAAGHTLLRMAAEHPKAVQCYQRSFSDSLLCSVSQEYDWFMAENLAIHSSKFSHHARL